MGGRRGSALHVVRGRVACAVMTRCSVISTVAAASPCALPADILTPTAMRSRVAQIRRRACDEVSGMSFCSRFTQPDQERRELELSVIGAC